MRRQITLPLSLAVCLSRAAAFTPAAPRLPLMPSSIGRPEPSYVGRPRAAAAATVLRAAPPADGKGGMEKEKSTKKGKGVLVIDDTDTEMQQDEVPEEQWRVVLHNDEVHTFNYVIRSLQKVMGTIDKKRAFDICTVTHGVGQATVETCWKEQAMKYCLGLQRQGLTASIAPDSKFEGGSDGDGGDGGPEAG